MTSFYEPRPPILIRSLAPVTQAYFTLDVGALASHQFCPNSNNSGGTVARPTGVIIRVRAARADVRWMSSARLSTMPRELKTI